MKNSTEREELKKKTYDKLISLFKKYIDWLVEEHDSGGKYQALCMRKSYDLLLDERILLIRIYRE